MPNEKVHLLTANVGGSFGMKNINYPEYVCILHAAKALGRPVKWTDERSTSFLSDSHGRAQQIHCELALDGEGKFLAVKVSRLRQSRRLYHRRRAAVRCRSTSARTSPASIARR